jgi:hypothetical protein
VGAASGGGGGDDGDGGGGGDDDGGDEDPGFQQYYTVSSGQQAFNEQAARGYLKHGGESQCIHPPSILRGCCKSELIGLGPGHVHAPPSVTAAIYLNPRPSAFTSGAHHCARSGLRRLGVRILTRQSGCRGRPAPTGARA